MIDSLALVALMIQIKNIRVIHAKKEGLFMDHIQWFNLLKILFKKNFNFLNNNKELCKYKKTISKNLRTY